MVGLGDPLSQACPLPSDPGGTGWPGRPAAEAAACLRSSPTRNPGHPGRLSVSSAPAQPAREAEADGLSIRPSQLSSQGACGWLHWGSECGVGGAAPGVCRGHI